MSAIPSPAVPAPWMTTRWSRIRDPAARTAENAAASTTAAVPCMSSLNVHTCVGVAVQDPPRVGGAEVLPVQHRVREQLLARGDVGVDELVVARVADPGVPLAQVHLVVEQFQVVGAHVQHHRQHPRRVDPGRRGVDRELADRDLDAADALVADPEDALGVRGHQQVDVVGAQPGVAQRGLDVLGVVDRQVHPARAAELVGELLDRQTRPSGCRRSAASPRCARRAACRTAPRCGCAGWSGTPTCARSSAARRNWAYVRRSCPSSVDTPDGQQPGQPQLPALGSGERRPAVDHRRRQHGDSPRAEMRAV